MNTRQNKRTRALLALSSALLVLVGWAGVVLAAGDTHGDPTAPTPVPMNDAIEAVVNFIIFIGALYFLGRKPIMEFLAQRRLNLAAEIEEAEKLRAEAEAKLNDYSKRLDRIDAERKEILDGYRERAEAERKAIVAEARAVAERMKSEAKSAIENDLIRAQVELKERIIDEAVETARQKIRTRMDAGTNARLVDEYNRELRELTRAEGGA